MTMLRRRIYENPHSRLRDKIRNTSILPPIYMLRLVTLPALYDKWRHAITRVPKKFNFTRNPIPVLHQTKSFTMPILRFRFKHRLILSHKAGALCSHSTAYSIGILALVLILSIVSSGSAAWAEC